MPEANLADAPNEPCRLCGAPTREVGPIRHPRNPDVGGVPIDLGDHRYTLQRCDRCGFRFKAPPIPEDELLRCYAACQTDRWEETPDPLKRRFDTIRTMVESRVAGGNVLDVGCFNGALLQYFDAGWKWFGVEPSTQAAELASRRGVTMLGDTIDQLPSDAGPFDAILLIDVAEHIVQPVPFFAKLAGLLRPGGVLMIVTGDAGSRPWKLEKNTHWYCSLPEHVSFYDRRSIGDLASRLSMAVAEYRRMSHARTPMSRKVREGAKNLAYVAGRSVGGLGVSKLRAALDRRAPPWLSAADHMFCLLEKEAQA